MRLSLERLLADPPITGRALGDIAWHPDGRRFTYLQAQEAGDDAPVDLWSCDLETARHTLLLRAGDLPKPDAGEPLCLKACQWLPDGSGLLLRRKDEIWRFWPADGSASRLAAGTDPKTAPALDPAGTRMAFVRGGNLWVRDIQGEREWALTRDGSADVLNGRLDWVYWEELANRKGWEAFAWSPDGARIAFLRLDRSRVPAYPMVDTLEPHPVAKRQRYPMAGDPNAAPSLLIVDAADGRVVNALRQDDSVYLPPFFAWTPDGSGVALTRMPRQQRSLELLLLPADGGAVRTLLTEADPFWVNHLGPAWFLPDGAFLWLSEREGRGHLYRHQADGRPVGAVTRGDWQVERVYGVHEGHVYFTATGEDARERHFCRAGLTRESCERFTEPGGAHTVEWSPASGAALITRETPRTPAEAYVWLPGAARRVVRPADPQWREYEWAEAEWVNLTAPDGTLLHGRLLRPPHFDPASRYPVVVHVYGGPHAQTVRKTWDGGDALEQLLAQAGCLVWRLDNRGSWGRGHAFETPVAGGLGAQELADQLEGVDYLRSLPYVDVERIAVTGWSYGGFLALYALTRAADVWACGIAGAPVTDWRLYDSVYTERYMGTPDENPDGYRRASILEAAGELRAPLLLVHGTDDDNVHLQHTLQLVDALARHRKHYELLLQPREKHGFKGHAARLYLHERMLEFFARHLRL